MADYPDSSSTTWDASTSTNSDSTPGWQPQPSTDLQTTSSYLPLATDYQSTTQWQPSGDSSSPVFLSTPARSVFSFISSPASVQSSGVSSATTMIPITAVASSIRSMISSPAITSSTTGLFVVHTTSSPQITIFHLEKGHYIAIAVCSSVILLCLIGVIVLWCRHRKTKPPTAAHQRIYSGHYQKVNRDNVESAYGSMEEIRRSQLSDMRSFYERNGSTPHLQNPFLTPHEIGLRNSRSGSSSLGSTSTSNRSSRQLLPSTSTRQIGHPISLLKSASPSPSSPLAAPPIFPPKTLPSKVTSPKAASASVGHPTSPFLYRLPGVVNVSNRSKARGPIPVSEVKKPISNITKPRLRNKLRSKNASKRLARKQSLPRTVESFQCAGEESDSDKTDPSIYSQTSAIPMAAMSLSRNSSIASGASTDESTSKLSVLFETTEGEIYQGGLSALSAHSVKAEAEPKVKTDK